VRAVHCCVPICHALALQHSKEGQQAVIGVSRQNRQQGYALGIFRLSNIEGKHWG
jgi:hypothetical protein